MADIYSTLSLRDVQHMTDILAPDILESAALLNSTMFNDLYIRVLAGTEFRRSQLVFNRKGGTTRRYEAGKTIESKLGTIEERKLEVSLSWNRYLDNIQNYREKEPWSVLGTNGTYNAPNSEFAIRNIGKSFSEDILSNLFFGKKALGTDSPLGLFDGYSTQIDAEITRGKVKAITLDPFTDQPEADNSENYDIFCGFIAKLSPKLKRQEKVIVYCSDRVRMLIIDGYLKKYIGLQTPNAADKDFRFIGMPNVELVSHPIIGDGDRLIATVPFNFEYGVDTLNDMATVAVDHDPNDFNVLIYQIQSAQGVRILRVSEDVFAVSNGSAKALEGLNGDYQKDTITILVDSTKGNVQISPQKESYTEGESITLTPQAESGFHFVKWSDNVTVNPRTVIFSGFPETYEAVFEADE